LLFELSEGIDSAARNLDRRIDRVLASFKARWTPWRVLNGKLNFQSFTSSGLAGL